MKQWLVILILMKSGMAFSQSPNDSVCYVTYVRGEIRKPCDKIIRSGDTMLLKDIPSLKYISEGSLVTLYHSKFGSFRVTAKEAPMQERHEDLMNFLAHLLKVKGRMVSLSSRGGCQCSAPQSCFYTDTTLNDKVLVVDSLSFVADDAIFAAESGYYFLQYNMPNRRPLVKKLKMTNGVVRITPDDLVFEDSIFKNGETAALVLGLATQKDGYKTSSLVTIIKFKTITAAILQDYYTVLQAAMAGQAKREIYETFCKDVYTFFGKPNECQLNKIINYSN